MSKFYVIGKASPELLKKMHADPSADRGAVMKSMCESLGVKAISYEWLRGRFDVLFCVEGDYESVLAMKVTVLNSGMMSDLMVHEVFNGKGILLNGLLRSIYKQRILDYCTDLYLY